jgi:hypothetical protein
MRNLTADRFAGYEERIDRHVLENNRSSESSMIQLR